MGRLVDENDVYNVLTEYYHHKTATQHVALIDALSTVKTADAIPVSWIRKYMKEVGLTDVKYMLETWEKEQIYGQTD